LNDWMNEKIHCKFTTLYYYYLSKNDAMIND
jgi:hypothetical protein